jgi:hypothetical protein
MAKGQKKSSREAKKPEAAKPKVLATSGSGSSASTTPRGGKTTGK